MKIFAIAVVMGGIAWAADSDASWSAKSAAAYLDAREGWWLSWPTAARDHDTACVSCHTALPYGLARNALGRVLRESAPSEVESKMLANIAKRVRLWSEVQPFYPDATRGVPKTAESRGTEAILNALILSAQPREPGELVQTAFENMWAIQLTSGDRKGAWMWLNFHNSPWEADDSQFYGTALAALVVGTAPEKYRPAENVKMLRDYLAREYAAQSPVNRIVALWADAKLGGILSAEQRKSLIGEIGKLQQDDGGWCLATLVGTWKRHDGTPLDTRSDGYATGLVTLVFEQSGVDREQPQVKRGLMWLARNQDRESGQWPGYSLNKKRDPATDVGKLMSDAATAYAVLALIEANKTSGGAWAPVELPR